MAHFALVAVSCDLGFPTAPHNLQRVIELEQKFHVIVITGVQQLPAELLGSGNLRGQFKETLI